MTRLTVAAIAAALRREAAAVAAAGASSARQRRVLSEIASFAGANDSLPLSASSTVFARVDEARPDVLSAIIAGPEGTPYENGQ